ESRSCGALAPPAYPQRARDHEEPNGSAARVTANRAAAIRPAGRIVRRGRVRLRARWLARWINGADPFFVVGLERAELDGAEPRRLRLHRRARDVAVAETEHVTDLVRQDRDQIDPTRVGVVGEIEALRVELDVRVEDLARVEVHAHRRLRDGL